MDKYITWYDSITNRYFITSEEKIKEVVTHFEKNIEDVSYKEFIDALKNKKVKES